MMANEVFYQVISSVVGQIGFRSQFGFGAKE
jgi:hypothetical protein